MSSPLACAAFFLPLFVARKDVVAGELPAAAAAATTQVQDGETERGEEEEGATVGGGSGGTCRRYNTGCPAVVETDLVPLGRIENL